MHLTQRYDQVSALLLFNVVYRSIVYYSSCYSLMNNGTWKPGDANDLNEQKNRRVTYGNGFTVHNEYDDFNRVTGIVYGTETDPRYEFRYNARGQAAWMKDGLLDRITETEYDLSDRPRRIKTHENGQHLYTGEVTYDALYGHLSTFTERVGPNRTEYKTTFGYDPEDRPTALNYGSANDRTNVTYDGLGRVSGRSVTVNGHSYDTAFSYVPGATNSKTTGLIQGITQSGENFTYTYDDVGNISSVTQNGKVTSYVYDAIGQLIRVNDQSDTTAGADGTTWTYEYDCGGNILNKKRYAYATGAVGTEQETATYSYTDANWRDKLTGITTTNITGTTIESISYDEIGNPLNDGEWTYTWENGRQLKEMSKGTAGQAGYMKVEYRYNSEGLRIQKIVTETTASGTTTTTIDYILHGKNIVHMIRGNDKLHFFYDASNRPAIVEYNGTKYAYIHNLQGDIVGIIDSTGTEVVKYTYDAWGKKLAVTGTLAGSLGVINPFRYRGYVYDEETGLYYLASRYYNPVFGRFSNLDAEINKNLYCYCSNSPILYKDASGFSKELSTDNICKFEGDDWGTNVSKLPVSVLISVAIHVYNEGDWEYQKGPITYKKIDCIGLILLAAKFHFTSAAFRENGYNIGLGTTSAATNNRSFALRKTSSTNIANLRVGTILYCPSLTGAARGHVGIYIGYYDDGNGHIIKHAVIHCHGKGPEDDKAGVSIVPFEGSRFDCAQGEYTEYDYLDYDMSYDDTVRKYKGFRYEEM